MNTPELPKLNPDTIAIFWEMLQQVTVSPMDPEGPQKLARLTNARDDMNAYATAYNTLEVVDGTGEVAAQAKKRIRRAAKA